MYTLTPQRPYERFRHQTPQQQGEDPKEYGGKIKEGIALPRSQKGILFREVWLVGNPKLNTLKNEIKQAHWLNREDTSIEAKKQNRYYVRTFNSITELLNNLQQRVNLGLQEAPYAIIADEQVVANGHQFLVEQIRTYKATQQTPLVVVCTQKEACFSQSDIVQLLKTGIDDLYNEPVRWADLETRLDFLHREKAAQVPQTDTAAPTAQKEPTVATGKHKPGVMKRAFDIFFSSLALIALSPLFIIVSIIIKLESKGPIFYKSKRAGTGYKVFNFYKFRSMGQGADKKLQELQHLNQYAKDEKGGDAPRFVKLANDPRVTRFGKFIRKTSIDELPQLINILKGDMSIVGNRPLPLYEAEQLTCDASAKRFLAPAGLTGLWQVTKRGKDDMSDEERIQLDKEYADKHSLLFDIQLIAKTIPAMLQEQAV